MKKIIVLLLISLLLVACNGDKGIKVDGETGMAEFSFSEQDFRKVYEENTGKAIPVSFEMEYGTMSVDDVSAEQVEAFLKTSYDLLEDDVIRKMYNSFKEDRDELIPDAEDKWRKVGDNNRIIVDYGILEEGKYTSSIYLKVESN